MEVGALTSNQYLGLVKEKVESVIIQHYSAHASGSYPSTDVKLLIAWVNAAGYYPRERVGSVTHVYPEDYMRKAHETLHLLEKDSVKRRLLRKFMADAVASSMEVDIESMDDDDSTGSTDSVGCDHKMCVLSGLGQLKEAIWLSVMKGNLNNIVELPRAFLHIASVADIQDKVDEMISGMSEYLASEGRQNLISYAMGGQSIRVSVCYY